jgi:transposase
MRSLFQSIQALRRAGMNKSAIARFLGVHRHTVQKYSALESAPRRRPRVSKASALAHYEDYILKRFTDGFRNATQIHKRRSLRKATPAHTTTSRASSST